MSDRLIKGDRLERLRTDAGLSQKVLANLVGVSTGTIAEWEADESEPSQEQVVRISAIFNVSMESSKIKESEDNIEDIKTDNTSELTTRPKTLDNKQKKRNKLIIDISCAFLILAVIVSAIVVGINRSKNDKDKTEKEIDNKGINISFSDNPDLIAEREKSVVKIVCYDFMDNEFATGSGFVAYDCKTIVTNFHVIESAFAVKVVMDDDQIVEVECLKNYSEEDDIAILSLDEDLEVDPIPIGNSNLIQKGEKIVAIGSPLGIKNTISTGILSGYYFCSLPLQFHPVVAAALYLTIVEKL